MSLYAAPTMASAAVLIACALSGPRASAQTPESPEAAVEESADADAASEVELVYSVNRVPERPFDTARAVVVIGRDAIERRNGRTLPELLMDHAGIFVQQTNYGGGSPVIRGLAGKQVLILLDGVRVNNSTYRFGFVQYLNTIDLNWVERVEIVRGIESVLSGDSLGGVINVITRKGPPPGGRRLGGALGTRFSSADDSRMGRVEAFGRTDKLRFLAGATLRDTSDVRGGGDVGAQTPTGYDERSVQASLEFFPAPDKTLSLTYHGLEQHDVPRTDRVLDGTNLRFDFDPQRLQILSLGYQDSTARRWADSLRVTLHWNRQDETQYEVRTASPGVQRRNVDRQTVLGAGFEFEKTLGASQRLVWGAEVSREDVLSRRTDVTLATGALASRRGKYTDGAGYDTLALYAQDRVSLGERVVLGLGLRYGRVSVSGSETSSVGLLDLAARYQNVTGSGSVVIKVAPGLNVVGSVTRGLRPPNIDDLSVFDERREGTEIPNPEASPERSLSYDLGLKFGGAKLGGSAAFHHSDLTDLLVRAGGRVDGLPFFDLNDNGLQERGEANVLQKQNLGRGRVEGLGLELRFQPRAGLALWGNVSRTVGDDLLLDAPLPRIPPTFGALGLYVAGRAQRSPWAELVFRFADDQRRLSAIDRSDTRVGPAGTDGFTVFDLRGGAWLARRVRLTLGVENLFDRRYKYHGSGVFRPGRQAVVGAEYRF